MKNILVIGASGQIGSEIKDQSKKINRKYWNFKFASSSEFDITQSKEDMIYYLSRFEIDVIINCAAYTAVDKADAKDEYHKVIDINYIGVMNLAEAGLYLNIPVILFSSDYVFSGKKQYPYTEVDEQFALTHYGYTKEEMEKSLIDFYNVYIIRTSWVYGQFGKNFVKTMLNLFNTKETIDVVIDQIGTPTYTVDLVNFIFMLIENIHDIEHGIYNYSNEGTCSWFDFAMEIKRLTGSSVKINPVNTVFNPDKADRPKYSVLDKTKVKTTFNIEIPYWKDSLEKCIKKLTNGNI